MNEAAWIALVKRADFKFDAARLRAENVNLPTARFLRWLLLNAPCANSEVASHGPGLAYQVLRSGYAANPLGRKGNEETNLWMLTPAGLDLLQRLADGDGMDRKRFESGIRKLTRNERVVAALLKGFESKNFTRRPELGLFPTDGNEYQTVLDWALKSGWLK